MLSFHAWPLDISLKPSQILKYVFYVFCILAAGIVCYSLWVSFYFLLVLPIFLLLLLDCYRRFVSLQHPESVHRICCDMACDQGLWRLFASGEVTSGKATSGEATTTQDLMSFDDNYRLDEFFLSRVLIVLSFKRRGSLFVER